MGYESLDDEVAEYFWSRRAAGACDAEVLMLMSTLTVCVNVSELDNKRWEGGGACRIIFGGTLRSTMFLLCAKM